MGTLGTRARNGKKPAPRRVERQERPHPAVAKLAVALREHREVLEQQAATAEILHALALATGDPQPVFEAIVDKAHRLCGAVYTILYRYDGQNMDVVAAQPFTASAQRVAKSVYPSPPRHDHIVGRAILDAKPVHTLDLPKDPRFPGNRPGQRLHIAGMRTRRAVLAVPLLRGRSVIGAISVGRAEATPFSKKEIALLQTFAAQAVIAIENVRLLNETKDALERQTATAEVLRVISNSPTDVQPVFDGIARNAMRLLGGFSAVVTRRIGDALHLAAFTTTSESGDDVLKSRFPVPLSDVKRQHVQAVLSRTSVYRTDTEDADVPPTVRDIARARGYRSSLTVPMLREGQAIGTIAVSRREAGTFSKQQTELLKTFADQAVIAIENARLFNETKEALEQQTATAEVLKVISSTPSNAEPVFNAIVQSAQRIMLAKSAALLLRRESHFVVAAYSEPGLEDTPAEVRTVALDREKNFPSRVILDGEVLHIPDWTAGEVPEHEKVVARAFGFGSGLQVPLLRDGQGIGALVIAREAKGPFQEKEIALLRSFADQAVIAIENARLFNETKEALDQQTATAQILSVIASSRSDLKPVMAAVVENAARLADASHALIGQEEGGKIRWLAAHGCPLPGAPRPITRTLPSGRAMLDLQTTQVEDVAQLDWDPHVERAYRELGVRSIVAAPLVREGRAIGVLLLRRTEVRAFTEKQLALLKTFANQAAIAIENVRLFNETKEALEQQTATSEVLGVISSSPTDLAPVFDAILQKAMTLCDAHLGLLNIADDDRLRTVAQRGGSPEFAKWVFERGAFVPDGIAAQALAEGKAFNIADAREGPGYRAGRPNTSKFVDLGGVRSFLAVPLMKEGRAIGNIGIYRSEVRPFTDKQVALVTMFANQAVIAIENVRLFKELQARTEALTKSVEQLTALGEVGRTISSTLDLEAVLKTIVSHAVQLTRLDAGAVYEYDERLEEFHLRAAENMSDETVERLRRTPIKKGDGAVGGTAVVREPIQIPETQDESYKSRLRDLIIKEGRRALLAVPLMRDDHIIGALAVQRNTPGPFAPDVVDLLKTFATQSAMAIQNARLFREIAEKGKQLEVASRHKSNFLASMSHELRTPLNALLGFNELILGEVYGEVPADMKPPLEQMQSSGKHLLRLINNVLDLAKIEAGRMELALTDYSVHDIVESVRSTLRPLAEEKGLALLAEVPADIPLAHGDPGRITQCLMNLAGNSLKFTKAGKVEISVALSDGQLRYCVADTGIGIPPDKIEGLFTEFKQTDSTIASEYGGTGLGLSISKKFVELHGGRIWVESQVGKGSAFSFEVPLRAGTA